MSEAETRRYREYFERAKRGEVAEGPNVLCPDCGTWMSVSASKTHECEARQATT